LNSRHAFSNHEEIVDSLRALLLLAKDGFEHDFDCISLGHLITHNTIITRLVFVILLIDKFTATAVSRNGEKSFSI
jgi:hypothetical protein